MKNVYLTRKKIKGRIYLYLEGRAWINGKSRRTWQKYLGSEDKLDKLKLSGILSKNDSKIETETLEFGLSAALWKIAQDIRLSDIISAVVGKRNQGLSPGDYFIIAAINRCVAPCSKSKLGNWFKKDWIHTQYEIKPDILNPQAFWNHFHYFTDDKIEEIQLKIVKEVIKKYNLEIKGLLYDPTNFYTFSKGGRDWRKGSGSDMLRFGNSKENRRDKRQVSFWLICDRDTGIPLFHCSYPGNCQDAGIFKEIPKRMDVGNYSREKCNKESVPKRVSRYLEKIGINLDEITMVFDNGNLSKEGMQELDRQSLKFIASRRPSTHKNLLSIPKSHFSEITLSMTGKSVQYYKSIQKIYGQERIVYTTLDPAKQKKKIHEFQSKLTQKKEEIEKYFKDRLDPQNLIGKQGLGQKWLKKIEVEKKVKKMIGTAPFNKILSAQIEGPDEFLPDHVDQLKIFLDINENMQKKYELTLGRSIIFTNQAEWNAENIIWGYRQQYIVEHAFRNMKNASTIAIRPMFHHSNATIPSHVFICVLSYLLLSILRLTLKQEGCTATFEEITSNLREVHVTKIFMKSKSNPLIKIDKTTGLASKIIDILNLRKLV
ncbi:MAG: IS1634 family transposase [Ignavibacteriales bacterium]|nr:IS1634 family transposase [Ignavibacteriales bacterium]